MIAIQRHPNPIFKGNKYKTLESDFCSFYQLLHPLRFSREALASLRQELDTRDVGAMDALEVTDTEVTETEMGDAGGGLVEVWRTARCLEHPLNRRRGLRCAPG